MKKISILILVVIVLKGSPLSERIFNRRGDNRIKDLLSPYNA